MVMFNWVYVSVSKIDKLVEPIELRKIVSTSINRNADLDVTGALLFTGVRFAQCIEGPEAAVAELRESIMRDKRHTAITTLIHGPIAEPGFRNWTLAFSGPSPNVSRTLNRSLRELQEGAGSAGTSVRNLLLELATKSAAVGHGLP